MAVLLLVQFYGCLNGIVASVEFCQPFTGIFYLLPNVSLLLTKLATTQWWSEANVLTLPKWHLKC